jgi:hypothetical protein
MKPSLGKLIKIIFKRFKHKKTVITNHEAYNKYLVMVCRKMTMKHGKVRKYDLEMVEKYDGKEGIFKAQHSPMLAILNVLMQTKALLFYGFYGFAYVGSYGGNIALKIEGVGSCGSTSLHTWMTKLP